MNFREFMDMYEDWCGATRVIDETLEVIVMGKTVDIMECLMPFGKRTKVRGYVELFHMEVVSFGFYDGVLCVRVK